MEDKYGELKTRMQMKAANLQMRGTEGVRLLSNLQELFNERQEIINLMEEGEEFPELGDEINDLNSMMYVVDEEIMKEVILYKI